MALAQILVAFFAALFGSAIGGVGAFYALRERVVEHDRRICALETNKLEKDVYNIGKDFFEGRIVDVNHQLGALTLGISANKDLLDLISNRQFKVFVKLGLMPEP